MPRTMPRLIIDPEIKQRHKHYQSFRKFHYENPQVLELILDEIDRAVLAGLKKVSIKTIVGKIRWDMTISTVSHDGFRINDKYTSLYAALISETWKEYAPLFEQREKRALQ